MLGGGEMRTEEKIPYIKTLMYIALADDTIDESEMQYFEQIAHIYGLDNDELNAIKDSIVQRNEKIEDIVAGITERETKLTLLYELLALCYVDDNYSIVEKQGMKRICQLMGIETTKLEELESVMAESKLLQEKINNILER